MAELGFELKPTLSKVVQEAPQLHLDCRRPPPQGLHLPCCPVTWPLSMGAVPMQTQPPGPSSPPAAATRPTEWKRSFVQGW